MLDQSVVVRYMRNRLTKYCIVQRRTGWHRKKTDCWSLCVIQMLNILQDSVRHVSWHKRKHTEEKKTFKTWKIKNVLKRDNNVYMQQWRRKPYNTIPRYYAADCLRREPAFVAECLTHSAAMCSRAWRAQWPGFDSARARPPTKELFLMIPMHMINREIIPSR